MQRIQYLILTLLALITAAQARPGLFSGWHPHHSSHKHKPQPDPSQNLPYDPPRPPSAKTRRSITTLTEAGLLHIAPNSASCAGAPYPSECRTAAQALPHIAAAFAAHRISHPAVQAALVSLMAYESGEFKYNVNHYPAPGTPGQGTRNMQSPEFNAAYARDLGYGEVGVEALMGVVGRDEHTFASAAWFVTTQCGFEVRQAMWGGGREAWEAYLTGCVGAALDDGRVGYWEKAMSVLNA